MSTWAITETDLLDPANDTQRAPMRTVAGECSAIALVSRLRRAITDGTVGPLDFADFAAAVIARVAARHPEITWPQASAWLDASLREAMIDAGWRRQHSFRASH